MTECDICKILENKETFKFVYEDDKVFAILHESPAVPGHTLVIPKKHATIIEELDDDIVQHLFKVANVISTALFNSLGALGTNILVNNGHDAGQELPHTVINVLPRRENDVLDIEWEPKKADENQLKTTLSMMQTYAHSVFSGKDKLPEVKIKEEKTKEKSEDEEEDYLTKSLKRQP